MKPANSGIIIAKLIAAVMLFATLGHHSYDYYTVLRWVVCGVCAYSAFQFFKFNKTGWLWTFVIIAAVFNPLIPVHLKRDTWAIIDFAVAVLLLVSIAVVDWNKSPP